MDEQTGEIIKEVSKEVAKEAYNDAGKPVLKPTGQTVGLVPRAIKAALLPVEIIVPPRIVAVPLLVFWNAALSVPADSKYALSEIVTVALSL